jgi:hypothetical protein
MISGNACITQAPDGVYVRFEGLGKSRFQVILNRFWQHFDVRSWSEKKRAWWLPLSDFHRVVRFCRDVFGPINVQVERASSSWATMEQPPLF